MISDNLSENHKADSEGLVPDVVVCTEGLTANEILELFNCGSGLRYPFQEGEINL